MKIVLAISGGGMRGVIPARFLMELEKLTGRAAQHCFDLIAGTSTGSILAAMCASPKLIRAADMMQFYYDRGPKIFPKRWFNFGVTGPKYRTEDLARELQGCLGKWTCAFAQVPLLIPTLDAARIEATFIKSWEPEWQSMPMWAAAAASSSAQTYFPAFKTEVDGKPFRFLDGGNHTNNPAASALFEAYRLWPQEQIVVVHFGTGKQREPKPLPDGGMAQWAPLVFGTTSEGQDDCANYFCANAPGVTVFDFDVSLERFPDMAAADKRTLDGLVCAATVRTIEDHAKWAQLAAIIKRRGSHS